MQCKSKTNFQILLTLKLQMSNVDMHGVILTDPVETSDPLFQQVGMCGQIQTDQMVTELEVPAFAADFRADQHRAPMFHIGEVSRRPIALYQVHVFMKQRNVDPVLLPQVLFAGQRVLAAMTDRQHLFTSLLPQPLGQPFEAGGPAVVDERMYFYHPGRKSFDGRARILPQTIVALFEVGGSISETSAVRNF